MYQTNATPGLYYYDGFSWRSVNKDSTVNSMGQFIPSGTVSTLTGSGTRGSIDATATFVNNGTYTSGTGGMTDNFLGPNGAAGTQEIGSSSVGYAGRNDLPLQHNRPAGYRYQRVGAGRLQPEADDRGGAPDCERVIAGG